MQYIASPYLHDFFLQYLYARVGQNFNNFLAKKSKHKLAGG